MRISLFGAVKLTKTNDPDKYKYFGHGTGFDVCGFFFFFRWWWVQSKCNIWG